MENKIQFIFNACTQTAIRFFTAKYQILKTVPKRPFVFHSKIRNFKTASHSLTTKYEIFKVVSKQSLSF